MFNYWLFINFSVVRHRLRSDNNNYIQKGEGIGPGQCFISLIFSMTISAIYINYITYYVKLKYGYHGSTVEYLEGRCCLLKRIEKLAWKSKEYYEYYFGTGLLCV